MKKLALATVFAAAIVVSAAPVDAQEIPVIKDRPAMSTTDSYGDIEFTGPLGYTIRPGGAPLFCADRDAEGVRTVDIEDDLRRPGMISEEQAKALALCAVPGQITSGDMETRDNRTMYTITIIPNGKQTHSKVDVDAFTGEIVNAQQFGGLRGFAGWLRESAERKRKTP